MNDYPALQYLVDHPEKLFPEERLELVSILGRIRRLEQVNRDAEKLIDAMPPNFLADVK